LPVLVGPRTAVTLREAGILYDLHLRRARARVKGPAAAKFPYPSTGGFKGEQILSESLTRPRFRLCSVGWLFVSLGQFRHPDDSPMAGLGNGWPEALILAMRCRVMVYKAWPGRRQIWVPC